MNGLTQPQAEMLEAIRSLSQGGFSPSFDELRDHLGYASKSAVHRIVSRLQERGMVELRPGVARSIRIVGDMEGLEKRSTTDLCALRDRIEEILRERAS